MERQKIIKRQDCRQLSAAFDVSRNSGNIEVTNQQRLKIIFEEMQHDAANRGLGETELRARLRYYRRQIIDANKEGTNAKE